jgi:multimeric flavodoxin WrbA
MGRLLAIAGSPRKGGNSDILLDSCIEGARSDGYDAEKIYICDKRIAPCDEKNVCFKAGICHIKDDMQEVYSKLLEADRLAVASPTFFMGPPAQLKAMIDRCQALWAKRFVLKQPLRDDDKMRHAFLLATSGLKKQEAFIGTKETMKAFFYVLGYKYKGELLVEGVDAAGDVKKHGEELEKARELGRSLKG